MALPDYHDVSELLRRAGSGFGAADCHAALSGLLVVNIATPMKHWLREALSDVEADSALYAEAEAVLGELFDLTRAQLQDSNLGFELLLPAEDALLTERILGLGQWCQGFVYGLALAGVQADTALPQNSAEFIRDVTEIARVGAGRDADDADEAALMELVEYLRVGVLLVNEELQPLRHSTPVQ